MSNPHPNTSGLRPFDKMDPDEAKRIRRLGGLAHAKQYFLAKNNNDILRYAKESISKEYGSWQAVEYRLLKDAITYVYEPYSPIAKRIKVFEYINNFTKSSYKQMDKMNELLYKTGSPEFQVSDEYLKSFKFNDEDDIQYLDLDLNIEDQEDEDAECTDTCRETNDESTVKEN